MHPYASLDNDGAEESDFPNFPFLALNSSEHKTESDYIEKVIAQSVIAQIIKEGIFLDDFEDQVADLITEYQAEFEKSSGITDVIEYDIILKGPCVPIKLCFYYQKIYVNVRSR